MFCSDKCQKKFQQNPEKYVIDQIHKDMKSRMDAVVKDEKLDTEQKGAMLGGLRRMEGGQVFKVLTPEQQKEVGKRVLIPGSA